MEKYLISLTVAEEAMKHDDVSEYVTNAVKGKERLMIKFNLSSSPYEASLEYTEYVTSSNSNVAASIFYEVSKAVFDAACYYLDLLSSSVIISEMTFGGCVYKFATKTSGIFTDNIEHYLINSYNVKYPNVDADELKMKIGKQLKRLNKYNPAKVIEGNKEDETMGDNNTKYLIGSEAINVLIMNGMRGMVIPSLANNDYYLAKYKDDGDNVTIASFRKTACKDIANSTDYLRSDDAFSLVYNKWMFLSMRDSVMKLINGDTSNYRVVEADFIDNNHTKYRFFGVINNYIESRKDRLVGSNALQLIRDYGTADDIKFVTSIVGDWNVCEYEYDGDKPFVKNIHRFRVLQSEYDNGNCEDCVSVTRKESNKICEIVNRIAETNSTFHIIDEFVSRADYAYLYFSVLPVKQDEKKYLVGESALDIIQKKWNVADDVKEIDKMSFDISYVYSHCYKLNGEYVKFIGNIKSLDYDDNIDMLSHATEEQFIKIRNILHEMAKTDSSFDIVDECIVQKNATYLYIGVVNKPEPSKEEDTKEEVEKTYFIGEHVYDLIQKNCCNKYVCDLVDTAYDNGSSYIKLNNNMDTILEVSDSYIEGYHKVYTVVPDDSHSFETIFQMAMHFANELNVALWDSACCGSCCIYEAIVCEKLEDIVTYKELKDDNDALKSRVSALIGKLNTGGDRIERKYLIGDSVMYQLAKLENELTGKVLDIWKSVCNGGDKYFCENTASYPFYKVRKVHPFYDDDELKSCLYGNDNEFNKVCYSATMDEFNTLSELFYKKYDKKASIIDIEIVDNGVVYHILTIDGSQVKTVLGATKDAFAEYGNLKKKVSELQDKVVRTNPEVLRAPYGNRDCARNPEIETTYSPTRDIIRNMCDISNLTSRVNGLEYEFKAYIGRGPKGPSKDMQLHDSEKVGSLRDVISNLATKVQELEDKLNQSNNW